MQKFFQSMRISTTSIMMKLILYLFQILQTITACSSVWTDGNNRYTETPEPDAANGVFCFRERFLVRIPLLSKSECYKIITI